MIDSKGILIVNINTGEDEDIISGIKSLHESSFFKPAPIEEDTREVFMLSSLGKSKKEKKKDKKRGKFDDVNFMGSGDISSELDDDDSEKKEPKRKRFLDADDAFGNTSDDDDLTQEITRENKREYTKKDKNDYEKKFNDEVTILYDLLDEVNKFGKGLERKYNTIESSKVRGISKYTSDLVNSILVSKTNKLQIVRSIADIKKTIIDLKIKAENKAKDKDGATSRDQIAASYISKLLGGEGGRGKFIKDFGDGGFKVRSRDDDDDDVSYPEVDRLEERSNENSDWERNRLYDSISQRLDDEDNPYRSPEGNKYIEYENAGVTICIKKCIDDGSWEFIALDRDNQEIFDYPIPSRKNVGTVRFSSDGGRATDGRGMSYKVIEFYSAE